MDASGYTYLHLEVEKEKLWVAIPTADVKPGEKITFLAGMTMQDFYSKTLDKTFPSIILEFKTQEDTIAQKYFGGIIIRAGNIEKRVRPYVQ